MIRVDASGYFLAAALILLLPLDWLAAAFFAAALHELGHIAGIYLAGSRVERIQIGFRGARIFASLPDSRWECLCAAAGPAVSLSLLLFARIFPKLAICGLVQGMFNLLPVYPMDGGRVLGCLLRRYCPNRAERIITIVECGVWGILLGIAAAASIWGKGGLLPFFCFGMGILRAGAGKMPCKKKENAVQ